MRLTRDDRHRIAEGLAQGLGYAEIARRLGRPTSTISREVARNTGIGGYRPDPAHVATARRARRRKPVPVAPVQHERVPEAVCELEERVIDMAVASGMPRTAAGVLGCLFTTDSGSLTAADLAARLRVSPASISTAVAYLDQLELITRKRDGRRERYVVDDDVWVRTWLASVRDAAMWAETGRGGAEVLGTDTPAGARLRQMSQFFDQISKGMYAAFELWQSQSGGDIVSRQA